MPVYNDVPPGYAALSSTPPTIVGSAVTVTDISAPVSRKLSVRFTDLARFNWGTPSFPWTPIETELLRPTPLLVYPRVKLRLPKKKGMVFCAPKLLLDEVTRYLSWNTITLEQQRIDETEEHMTGRSKWDVGIDLAHGPDSTVYQNTWGQVWGGAGIPAAYLGLFSEPPPENARMALAPIAPPKLEAPRAVYNKSAIRTLMRPYVPGKKRE